MEYIIVENGIISKHGCAKTKPENAIEVPSGFAGYIGLPFAALREDLSGLKPLSQQLAERVIDLPDGYKVNKADNEFIRMEQAEIDEKYPVKTYAAEGSFEAITVGKTFDRDGNFGYWPPEEAVEMSGKQPDVTYRAVNGQWVFDLSKGKELKLAELATAFEKASANAGCQSSLGFEINADETANRNIEGLTLVLQPGESALFRAYDNSFHEVTREELETMRREIVKNSQWLYQAKWTLENRIATAETVEALEAIMVSPEALAELAGILRVTAAGEGDGQTE